MAEREKMKPTTLTLPDRATWLAARREAIGGSDAAAVVGASPWATPLSVYMDKLGMIEPGEVTLAMRLGVRFEAIIAELYAEETGREVVQQPDFTISRSPLYPFMAATFDRLVVDRLLGPGVLQIKTTHAYAEEDWTATAVPLAYEVQLQHEIAVADVAWGSFAVLIGGQQFKWLDRVRNDSLIAGLVEHERAFWEHVQRRTPPPAGETKADRALLARLYPRDSGEIIEFPPEMAEWDELRLDAIALMKGAEAIKDRAENRLKDALKEASVGVLPNGDRYSWTTSERAGYTVQPTTVRTLRRHSR